LPVIGIQLSLKLRARYTVWAMEIYRE